MMADIHKIMYNIHKVQLPETCSVYRKDDYNHSVLHGVKRYTYRSSADYRICHYSHFMELSLLSQSMVLIPKLPSLLRLHLSSSDTRASSLYTHIWQ